ncbi:MAG: isoleucine--tRNA ligase [Alphaproteobacteria bacterium]|nr:isoleucine--tRNA ligase [Alphaproteobacteria bacterium]
MNEQAPNRGETSRDYKDTVFLPETAFPMRGELPKREPQMLERWKRMDLFKRLRETAAGRPKFVLHDGPPYANGHLHIGHALNKILKDVINRVHQMKGEDANYVPGWDCHGLPIEWKIEEEYRAKSKDKDSVPIIEFRKQCRDFAAKWIDIQREEFKRLGVEGDWSRPYTTMTLDAEAQIVRELHKFALNGGLYRGARPVMWSVVEKTALAEAEIEYHDHKSDTVWVRFPVVKSDRPELAGAAIVIWTTTPWTMPANRALAIGEAIEYRVCTVSETAEGSLARAGEKLVIASDLVASVEAQLKGAKLAPGATLKGKDLLGTVCAHPFRGWEAGKGEGAYGYEFDVRVFAGGFVTTDAGTGIVHIAPSHGRDDFELGHANGLPVPDMIDDAGVYLPPVKPFAGKRIYTESGKPGDANGAVIKALVEVGALLAKGSLRHEYPHSWRSKAPLIFRNTPQWFISMATNDLRAKALQAIADSSWFPPAGENRLRAMIEQRPDWCISRQRAWGVPIAVFVKKGTGELLRDAEVFQRIADAFAAEGSDAWWSSPPSRFLGNRYDPAQYEQIFDIVDVWFESGSTHSFVCEARPELKAPATLYLEGSDQHRGWFHSSLLESCGTRGHAPFEGVLTHGFVLDEQGRKMSKSLGNVVAPQEVVDKLGADILRLWVVASDYSEDLRIGPEILKQQSEIYRRLRNTLRYLLGALKDFTPAERVPVAELPELERFVLHRLVELDEALKRACATYEFNPFFTALHNFCAVDLSALYFDIRKDALYCDRPDSPRRRAARSVMATVFDCVTKWLAPVLCFTAEEAWLARHQGDGESVHLQLFPEIEATWRNEALARKWQTVRDVRRVVTGCLEKARERKEIGSSLQAAPVVHLGPAQAATLEGLDLEEIFITSGHRLVVGDPPADPALFRLADVPDVAVAFAPAEGNKCQRCWKVLPEVGRHPRHPALCERCADAVDHSGG